MDRWVDGQMDLERDREGLQTWETLSVLLSRDFIIEPYHDILSLLCGFPGLGLQSPEVRGALGLGAGAWTACGPLTALRG